MTPETNLDDLLKAGLMRHQAQYADQFLGDNLGGNHLLTGKVGIGKSFLGSFLCLSMFQLHLADRILIIAPSALCQMYYDTLSKSLYSDAIGIINIRRLRELQADALEQSSLWPIRFVAIVSHVMLRREEISSSIRANHWDLVLVDEAQSLTGISFSVVDQMIKDERVTKSLFMTATPTKQLLGIGNNELYHTMWDHEGPYIDSRFDSITEPSEKIVTFERSKEEFTFLNSLLSSIDAISAIESQSVKSFKDAFFQRAVSSIFSAEQTLLRLSRIGNQYVHASELASTPCLFSKLFGLEEVTEQDIELKDILPLVSRIPELLALIDDIQTDKKTEIVLDVIRDMKRQTESNELFVCIFCACDDTVSYIESIFLEQGHHVQSLLGRSSAQQREEAFTAIRHADSNLVLVTSITEGVDLSKMDVLIHYDIPVEAMEMEQRRGRVNRLGRTKAYTEIAFFDKSGAIRLEHDLLTIYFPTCFGSS